jgi:hypothetical protein
MLHMQAQFSSAENETHHPPSAGNETVSIRHVWGIDEFLNSLYSAH